MQLWRAVQILAAPLPFTPHRTYLYWASRTLLEQAAGMYPAVLKTPWTVPIHKVVPQLTLTLQ